MVLFISSSGQITQVENNTKTVVNVSLLEADRLSLFKSSLNDIAMEPGILLNHYK